MTTAEEIFIVFESISSNIDEWYLPKSDQAQTNLINVGLSLFNQKMFDSISYDDMMEQLSKKLTSTEIIILARCMLYTVLNNIALEFVSSYGSSSSAIGVRSYKAQYDSKQLAADTQMRLIDQLVFSVSEYEDGDN